MLQPLPWFCAVVVLCYASLLKLRSKTMAGQVLGIHKSGQACSKSLKSCQAGDNSAKIGSHAVKVERRREHIDQFWRALGRNRPTWAGNRQNSGPSPTASGPNSSNFDQAWLRIWQILAGFSGILAGSGHIHITLDKLPRMLPTLVLFGLI